jgi:hypothetical protein
MSCYFRYIKDILKDAGINIAAKNKKAVDQVIHQVVNVRYKKCMPDCWGEVKKLISSEKGSKTFISDLRKGVKGLPA